MKVNISKEELESLLKQGLSGCKIAKQFNCSPPTIRDKMKKWGLKSSHVSIMDRKCYRTDTHKQCPKCLEIKEIKHFERRPNKNIQSYCKKCSADNSYSLMKRNKILLVKEFGGCCCKCGYNKNTSALEFHHMEPEHKDFHFGKARTTNIDKIRTELDKCILVCANCHREIHYPQNNT